jgi:hypothetical protein
MINCKDEDIYLNEDCIKVSNAKYNPVYLNSTSFFLVQISYVIKDSPEYSVRS